VGASGNKGLMQRYRISLYLSNNVACAASSLGALPDTAFLKNNLVGIYDNVLVVKRDSLFLFSVTKLISTRFFLGASGNKGLMQRHRVSLYLPNNVACAASSLGAL
jgi:hypothetical protein